VNPSSYTLSNFFCRRVKDETGHDIGRILYLSPGEDQASQSVLVETEGTEFLSYPVRILRPAGDAYVLVSPLKQRTQELHDAFTVASRRKMALAEVSAKQSLPSDILNEIEKDLSTKVESLKSEAKLLLEEIGNQVTMYADKLRNLSSVLVNLEIERQMGEIDSNAYFSAKESLVRGLARMGAIRKDLEQTGSRLSNVLEAEYSVRRPLEVTDVASSKPKGGELLVKIEGLDELSQ